jgi:hypothetical protein
LVPKIDHKPTIIIGGVLADDGSRRMLGKPESEAQMSFRHGGNGESKTLIDFHEGAGYVLICPRDTANHPADIAVIINRAFNDWMAKHPGIRIRSALPITREGNTVALHVWFDRPDVPVPPPKESE